MSNKKKLKPNLEATNTSFKRKNNDAPTEKKEDKNTATPEPSEASEPKEQEQEQEPKENEKDKEPTHTMENGDVVEIKKRTVGKAGRPRARQYNNKGTRPTTFNMPIDMKEQIESCAFYSKVEQADIIRTALKYFLGKHAVSNSLTPDGERLVRDFIKETSIK